MTDRSTDLIARIPTGLDRSTIITKDVTRALIGDRLDPFLNISWFQMTSPTFPPHPHAGFAVMTYMLPETESAFLNQDSTGFANRIAPGELHLTVTGSGVQHEETNETVGASALAFQIWLDLAAEDRGMAPGHAHLKAAEIPELTVDGATLRVLSGTSNGLSSPLRSPTPFRLVDVILAPGAVFEQALTETEHALLYGISGTYALEGDPAHVAGGFDVLVSAQDGDVLRVQAGDEGARFLLFAGEPLRQPVVFGGPFVASDEAQLKRYRQDFAAGKMGHLTPFTKQAA